MNITEQPISGSMLESIHGAAAEGATIVAVSIDAAPRSITEAINVFVSNAQKKKSPEVDNWEQRALPIGALWGQQLTREFGWDWSGVTFHDQGNSKAVGVFSKDRSLAVYPFHFVFGCLENNAPVTILLSFNMLLAGKIPALPANGFQNLMDGVRHIVPPS